MAFWVGTAWGSRFACSRPSSGNLCGLLGFIVVGPLSSIITVSVVSWLITYFPLQTKRFVLTGVFLFLLAGGYYFSSVLVGTLMHQSLVYRYRLQSGNLDDLRRYAPVIEAQMRELSVLKDVSVDTQLRLALPATITTSLAKAE